MVQVIRKTKVVIRKDKSCQLKKRSDVLASHSARAHAHIRIPRSVNGHTIKSFVENGRILGSVLAPRWEVYPYFEKGESTFLAEYPESVRKVKIARTKTKVVDCLTSPLI